ncbi:MAG: ABC transporter permease [Chthoniobacterales bacterium]
MSKSLASFQPESLPDEDWTKTIEPRHSLLQIRWREIWQYRDLIYLLVKRDFTAQYKQTVLGPLWFLIQPLVSTTTFTIIFGSIAKLSTDSIPPFLFYMCGLVAWSYFADCLLKSASTFSSNASIFGKVYFPRLTVPIANAITNLITFGIQFSLFLLIWAIMWSRGAPIHPTYRILILPVLILQMAMLGIGVGCLVSSLTTRYRDLSLLVGFGVQLWMYVSCVIIPLSDVSPQWRWIMVLNPMVPIIESFRFAFFGAGIVEVWQLAVGAGVSIGLFLVGVMVFRHVERTFSDTI